jgi:RNA recognition motif-containing protein
MASEDTKVETKPAETKLAEDTKPETPAKDGEKTAEKKEKGKGGQGKGNRGRAPSGPKACGNGYRLNVKNLNPEMELDKVKELFTPFGTVSDAQLKMKDTGKSMGLGFVVFEKEEDAQAAVKAMHDKEIDGKKLSVYPAERREREPMGQGQWVPWGAPSGSKGKGKQAAMTTAMQAYAQAYSAYMAQSQNAQQQPNEEYVFPAEYTGTIKWRFRYGSKTCVILCEETFQYLGCDIHVDADTVSEGVKDNDKVKFTVATKYKPYEWDKKSQSYQQLPFKGYPKAKTVSKA